MRDSRTGAGGDAKGQWQGQGDDGSLSSPKRWLRKFPKPGFSIKTPD